jgi:hypothetical protein
MNTSVKHRNDDHFGDAAPDSHSDMHESVIEMKKIDAPPSPVKNKVNPDNYGTAKSDVPLTANPNAATSHDASEKEMHL